VRPKVNVTIDSLYVSLFAKNCRQLKVKNEDRQKWYTYYTLNHTLDLHNTQGIKFQM